MPTRALFLFCEALECARVLASLSALSRYHAKITKIPPGMKNLFAGSPYTKFIAAASAFIWTISIATSARGVELRAARVTQVVNDVKVLLEKPAPRPVALSDVIRHGAAVSTGTQSRSELTFNDLTITRLGANTTFSFKEGTREMNLIDGAILFRYLREAAARQSEQRQSPPQSRAPPASANFIPPPPATRTSSASGFAWKGHSAFIWPMVSPWSWVPGKWLPPTARAFRQY